jgi:hypothetical protein
VQLKDTYGLDALRYASHNPEMVKELEQYIKNSQTAFTATAPVATTATVATTNSANNTNPVLVFSISGLQGNLPTAAGVLTSNATPSAMAAAPIATAAPTVIVVPTAAGAAARLGSVTATVASPIAGTTEAHAKTTRMVLD